MPHIRGSTNSSVPYRPEIDGLRAIAVLPVIFYHAGFGIFSGGFVGVDVFFVISGYLITKIIITERKHDRFSLLSFYERRVRRLFPALFVVLATCMPFAWLFLLPSDLRDFSQSLVAVSIFASNVFFWIKSDYFSTAAELKPLLHTWSLALEEQFYFIFPLFLIAASRRGSRFVIACLGAVTAASFLTAHIIVADRPTTAFFLLPTRAWELSMGAILALKLEQHGRLSVSKATADGMAILGLGLIVFAVLAFDETTSFPSAWTLFPTLGTALVIVFSSSETNSGRLLGCRFLAGIGTLSYGAYLWHQPLFAFVRHFNFGHSSATALLALAALSFLLAWASWRFVEAPFRSGQGITRAKTFLFALAGTVCFVTLGLIGHAGGGFSGRYDVPAQVSSTLARPTMGLECFDAALAHVRDDWYCPIGATGSSPSFALVGDSHVLSLSEAFHEAALSVGASGIFLGASGCPPLPGIHSLRSDQHLRNCNLLNERVFNYITANRIPSIILVARWSYYTDGGYDGRNFSYLGLASDAKATREGSRAAFREGVRLLAARYVAAGVDVLVVDQVPQQLYEARHILYRAYEKGDFDPGAVSGLSVRRTQHRALQEWATSVFTIHPGINFVSFDDVLCDADRCLAADHRGSRYFDDDHLSAHGASLLKERIGNLIGAASGR